MNAWRGARRRRWLGSFVLACLLFLPLVLLALPWLLIAPAQAPPSDVILHYAIASDTDADEYVVQLYRQQVGKKIVCIALNTQCETYADYARQQLLALGVPAEDLLTFPLPSASCLATTLPRFTELMQTHHWQRAVLVLHPQITRTDGRLMRNYFRRAGLELAVTYAPGERARFTPLWWTKYQTAQAVTEALINGALDQIYPECR